MIHGHGGNIYALARRLGCNPADIVDMSSNINPLGMPPGLAEALKDQLSAAGLLPEVDGRSMIERMADLLGVAAERMLAGNGTTQFIYSICPALGASKVLIVGPTYADYGDACRMYGIDPQVFLLDPEEAFRFDGKKFSRRAAGCDTVIICNPNNPTAGLIDADQLRHLCRMHADVRFVIDESYLPFVPDAYAATMAGCGLDNVIVLWSASKIFSLPGLRAGFLIASGPIRARFAHYQQPWCVNSLAQAAMQYLAERKAQTLGFIQQTRVFLERERRLFQQRLASCSDLHLYPSTTSYFLMRLPRSLKADAFCDQLARQRLLIRDCSNFFGLSDRFVRVALKSSEVNRMAADRLATAVATQAAAPSA
jgi:threonine-phosphate decarboxylase